jgi:hypothetical protein
MMNIEKMMNVGTQKEKEEIDRLAQIFDETKVIRGTYECKCGRILFAEIPVRDDELGRFERCDCEDPIIRKV